MRKVLMELVDKSNLMVVKVCDFYYEILQLEVWFEDLLNDMKDPSHSGSLHDIIKKHAEIMPKLVHFEVESKSILTQIKELYDLPINEWDAAINEITLLYHQVESAINLFHGGLVTAHCAITYEDFNL